MKTLSVLIPYRGRIANLSVLAENLARVDKSEVEFHLIVLGDCNPVLRDLCADAGIHFHYLDYTDVFSIGIAHNYGAQVASGLYLLKQDVDNLPYLGFYEKLMAYIEELRTDFRAWANIGAFFCTKEFTDNHLSGRVDFEVYKLAKHCDDYKTELKIACSNCYLVNRKHFLRLGGSSALFRGWGWEDYHVLYRLEKSLRPDFRLSSYQLESVAGACRDDIARPKNAPTNARDLVFLHRWHAPENDGPGYRSYIEQNRRVLWNLVNSFVPNLGE